MVTGSSDGSIAASVSARNWLFPEACGVEGVLEPDIQHEPLHDVVIGIVQQLLDGACPDYDIYGRVRLAVVLAIKDTERFFFDFG